MVPGTRTRSGFRDSLPFDGQATATTFGISERWQSAQCNRELARSPGPARAFTIASRPFLASAPTRSLGDAPNHPVLPRCRFPSDGFIDDPSAPWEPQGS